MLRDHRGAPRSLPIHLVLTLVGALTAFSGEVIGAAPADWLLSFFALTAVAVVVCRNAVLLSGGWVPLRIALERRHRAWAALIPVRPVAPESRVPTAGPPRWWTVPVRGPRAPSPIR
ncbi:MAG: hypothetical protein QM809_03505 [Gordonia sp. (in: high G+C Gram-positive bacteria)]|uniref:hypothetical protein n=1 Tax=Gordonia sp. (in: high G+C Gram-positive bacteria) TaxID=84139 RepID=UPI0039E2BC21